MRDAFPTATILRPSVVFGPEDQFFNRFAAIAMIIPALPLIGGGETRFQPVYVGDVADAVIAASTIRPLPAAPTSSAVRVYTFRALLELLLDEIRPQALLPSTSPLVSPPFQARLLSLLPNAPLTPDQVELLKGDNSSRPAP